MKIVSLILLSFLFFGYSANAQDATITMSLAEYEIVKAQTDSLSTVIVNNKVTIDSLNNSLREQVSVIEQLKEQLQNATDRNQRADSVIVALNDTLSSKTNELVSLKKEIAALDMVRLRYANGRLQLPYNHEKVNEAIELFNGISDANLRNECSEIVLWLRKYSFYLHDVKELILSLQADNRRENKFAFDEWRSYALKSISQNMYVNDSHGHQFSIIYLDEILSMAKSRISKATKPTVDFSDLIDRLQL
jgi:uncharacterized coiled-coil protein SlyX